jgi:hypothetical protein
VKLPLAIAVVTLPPLVLLGVGLTHPATLTVESAGWWTTMHQILVPLFALLAVSVFVLLRRDRSPLALFGRIAAGTFTVFYGTLDAVSGIATGVVAQAEGATDGASIAALFATGRIFAYVGGYSLLAAAVAVAGVAWLAGSRQWYFWVGAAFAIGGAALIARFHIYFPYGTATMACLAVGFALLELSRQRLILLKLASSPEPSDTHSSPV